MFVSFLLLSVLLCPRHVTRCVCGRAQPGDKVVITKALVQEKVSSMLKNKDLSKFIL